MNKPREDGGMGATSRRAVAGGGTFRPEGPAQQAIRRNALTTNDALVYLREVKQRFHNRKDVYDSFLDVMKDFKAQRIDIATVIKKVKELLKGHNDLILGFNTFLPKGSEITLSPERREAKPAVELDQAITYINKIKARFANDERVYKNFLEILCCFRQGRMDIHAVYREVADLFRTHEDLLDEFGYFLPDHSQDGPAAQDLLNTSARAMAPLSSQSNTIDGGYSRRRSARNSNDARRGPRDQLDYERELRFFAEVKSKLNNRETYTDLLKCVNLYAQDVISKPELLELVQDVIGKHPDVMATFMQFIGSSSGVDDDLGGESNSREAGRGGLAQVQRSRALLAQRNKYLTRPVSELDTTTLERPTTSYVRLPKDYPIMKCSGRTVTGEAVLQDELASVTTGTEDSSFKHMRKNQYEENLFRCEDERYDLEMAIERNTSAMKALGPIQDRLANLSPEERANYSLPEGSLNPVHCRIIERIYSDKGRHVLELLKKNPVIAMPVVLSRMQQKDQEWRHVRETMNAHWQSLFQTNYHKSLDHRSFYFKQSDKKNLAPKQLILDIKDAAEKLKSDDQQLLNLSTATTLESNLQAHMTFDYSDRAVHEDVYDVVRFAASKMLSADAYKQAMDFWSRFVEPYFGVTPHEVGSARSPSAQEEEPQDMDMGLREDLDDDGGVVEAEEDRVVSGEISGPATPPYAMKDAAGKGSKDSPGQASDEQMGEQEEQDFDGTKALPLDRQQDPSRLFGGCQPLVAIGHKSEGGAGPSSSACVPPEAPSTSPPSDSHDGSVLYCNEPFYLFFRLHHYLYDRLWMARKCCRSQEKGAQPNSNSSEVGEPSHVEDGEEAAEKVHGQFRAMVYQLIDNTMEMSQFEDMCRSLLSTNSYVLFTLDKLIFRMIKHIQALVLDEISLRVWDLYKYERQRNTIREEMYLSNCKVVLREDQVYRVERTPENQLTVQMMSPDIMVEMGGSIVKPSFMEYYKGFVGKSCDNGVQTGEGFTPVLLRRNVPTIPKNDDGRFEAEHLSQFYMDNGLEGRISCETSKLAYVLGSEDVLVKKKKRKDTRAIEISQTRRTADFKAWLNSKTSTPAAVPPPQNTTWQQNLTNAGVPPSQPPAQS
ncbi:hypothetical protein BSKO_09180 [Bryopsis sp. KO-2023]|nr:hypothetical protein BSKO_09180 [Bryopsis sp. KO-2023]